MFYTMEVSRTNRFNLCVLTEGDNSTMEAVCQALNKPESCINQALNKLPM